MFALECDGVSKTFRAKKTFRTGLKKRQDIRALKDVNLQIPEGEVFGFIGPNGAGKSTTIKVMLDIINDYEGEVKIYGIPARQAEARKGVAYLPEVPALYEQFTPLEILRTALRMYGIRRADEKAWCMRWLERLDVARYASRRIRQLSKGNVQRVAIAHTLVTEPRLLVLDEPLSGLDPVGRKDVVEILLEYKNAGGAIFFTSHVLHDVERIADRFGFINQGELVTTRSPRELLNEHADRFIVRYHSNSLTDGEQLREAEYQHELNQTELPEWINKLNSHSGVILNITPATSLESVFFHILQQNIKPGGKVNNARRMT